MSESQQQKHNSEARSCCPSCRFEVLCRKGRNGAEKLTDLCADNTANARNRNHGALGSNPLDTYVEESITRALKDLAGEADDKANASAATPYFSHRKYAEFGENYVPIQRLAHACGLSFLSEECHMCLHPKFGPWFSLRAVVLFSSVQYDGQDRPPPTLRLTETGKRQLKAQLDKAVQSMDRRDWIELRSLASRLVGCEGARYSDNQLRFHYYQDRSVLVKERV